MLVVNIQMSGINSNKITSNSKNIKSHFILINRVQTKFKLKNTIS